MSTRAVAARILQQVIYGGDSLTDALLQTQAHSVAANEQALLRDLCFGTLRWHERFSALLGQLLCKPLKAADKDVECLLRVGLYQLIYQRTPDHAAVNETVKAVKKLRKAWAEKLVNGVLRRFLRERDELLALTGTQETARYAFPAWLLARIRTAWPDNWECIVQASNTHAPMTLRVNQRQYDAAAYRKLLETAGLNAEPVPGVASALQLDKPVAVEQLPGFLQGAVSVQDAVAQRSAFLLDCQPGMRVLDACAAPGGKTGHLLEHTPDVQVTALDSSEARLQRVTDNLQRLDLSANVVAADAGDTVAWWDGRPFARILLDAPCSATGVIRRHPDIKVLRRDSDIAALQQEQARLLRSLWATLAAGGRLLYATCSILPEENHQQVAAFLATQQDAVHVPIVDEWGHAMPVGRQILPGEMGMDGFYYALLEKRMPDVMS